MIHDEAFANAVDALYSERNYQDKKWCDLDRDNTLEDFIKYMNIYQGHLNAAKTPAEQLDCIRKVAALGVAAMEKFGAPQREGYPVCKQCGECRCPGYNEECPKMQAEAAKFLTEDQIDTIVKNEQDATKVVRGKWYRVNETSRTYTYGGTNHCIVQNVVAFCVMENGAHRLFTRTGLFAYIQPGWLSLAVETPQVSIL